MILTTHLITGAALASKIQPRPLAFIVSFLSHYFLDFLPHQEYSIENIKEKRWGKAGFDFLKVTIDLSLGILLIFIFAKSNLWIFVGGFFAILSDGLTFLNSILPNRLLKEHENFHQKVHFFKFKKFPLAWKVLAQILISGIAILFLNKTF